MKKKVLEFQIQAGEILKPTQEVIKLKNNLLREEYQELLEALEEAFGRVHESNMTKFAPTEEGAKATVAEYLGEGVVADYSEVGGLYTIYRKRDGKVLKYLDYEPVNLEDLC